MFDTSSKEHYDAGYNYLDEILMDDLILELDSDTDEMIGILTEIEMLMYDLNLDLKGNIYSAYADKFKSYKGCISKIREKLNGYQNDLIKFKNTYKKLDKNTANKFDEYSDSIKNETRKIYES